MKPPKTQIQTVVNPVKECVLTLVGSHTPKPEYLMREEDYIEKRERLIPLTQGQFAIVDENKYEELIKYKWYAIKGKNTYYAMRRIRLNHPTETIYISMHTQILGYPTGCEIDHKNHNGIDNRIRNLRTCTRSQNQGNRRNLKRANTTSIFKGVHVPVYYQKHTKKKWASMITFEYNRIFIGLFNSEIEAAKAYDTKALELFGEFAYVNF